jgi:DNA excision repair protein ERCC-4
MINIYHCIYAAIITTRQYRSLSSFTLICSYFFPSFSSFLFPLHSLLHFSPLLHTGFNKVENILKRLYIKKLYLWPRFQVLVSEILDRNVPDVVEVAESLTKNMKDVQNALLVALNSCISELKKAVTVLDTTEFTLQNGLFHSFDSRIRSQLDAEWHKLSPRAKQLVADLTTLRKLLDFLLRYDAFSFYSFLITLKAASALQTSPSLW